MSIFRTPYSDGRVQKYIFNVLCIAIKVIYLSLKQAAARWHHFQKPCLVMDDITYLMVNDIHLLQVNLCQNHLFLHQLTHNMTTDCSLNYKFSTWKFQAQNMLCTQIVFLFCFDIQNNLCTQHVLSLEFSCTELIISWTILCHIMG